MTAKEDWQGRAECLRMSAARLTDKANALIAEAQELTRIANECDREATRAAIKSELGK